MFALSPADVTAIAVFLHVLALAPGLGCALAADSLALSTLVRPLGPRGLKFLGWLHKTILISLILMWLSGLAMVAVKMMPGGDGITPKLMIKLMTVLVLSTNALAIGAIALPELRKRQGQTFAAIAPAMRLRLGVIGGVSSACWMSALALGTVAVLKPMGYGMLLLCLGPVVGLGVVAGVVVALAAPRIASWVGAPEAPTQTPAPLSSAGL